MAKKVVKKKGKDTVRNHSPHDTRPCEMTNEKLTKAAEAKVEGAQKELGRRNDSARGNQIGEEGKKNRQAKKQAKLEKDRQKKIELAADQALYSGDSRKMK